MDDHEEEGKDDSGKKDEDAAELVNQKVANAEGGHHHHSGVVLLQGFHLNLKMENHYIFQTKAKHQYDTFGEDKKWGKGRFC